MTATAKKEKIVILGGGIGALTTAFALSQPGWQDRFESITIYQLGWRLGGKGASGRGQHHRIEEHGFHLWFGFYENAFRLIQQCYVELNRPPGSPLASWDEAFKKAPLISAEDRDASGWINWVIPFPEDDRIPGVPDNHDRVWTAWHYIKRTCEVMYEIVRSIISENDTLSKFAVQKHQLWNNVHSDVTELVDAVKKNVAKMPYTALAAAVELVRSLAADVTTHSSDHHQLLLRLLDAYTDTLRGSLTGDRSIDDKIQRLVILLDFSRVQIRGIVTDGLLTRPDGFSSIDHYEYSDWLQRHGASEDVLRSGVVRALYDSAFAYEDGDEAKRSMGAGIAVRCIAQMFFAYKGAVAWKMQAGMGDVVFAPLYLVLKQHGVRFRFFHRVKNLGLSADHRSIATVEMARQVDLVDESEEYQPLFDVRFGDQGMLPCWPAEPLYEQIRDGEKLHEYNL
ncbi:MAG: NAD(P)-binding protein [Candidatus Binatia bacterium]